MRKYAATRGEEASETASSADRRLACSSSKTLKFQGKIEMCSREICVIASFGNRGLVFRVEWKERRHSIYTKYWMCVGSKLMLVRMHPKDAASYMQRLELNSLLRN